MNTGKLIFGISAAFATGALLGVFLAPESGYNLRKKMLKIGDDVANNLDDRIDERIKQLIQEVDSRLESWHEQALMTSESRSN